jgi:uncharacterized membrane protein YheB (UPF0754 family)
MNLDVAKLDLWFRRILSVTTVTLGGVQLYLSEKNLWVDSAFVVLMAGAVGYYTNFLAIKMLFQPKQGKVLGWEGLVPKNKSRIAQSLGGSIQRRLLAPEIILAYVYEKNLIEKGTEKVGKWLDELLQDEGFRATVTTKIINLLKEKGHEIIGAIFNLTEETLREIARNPEEIYKYWEQIRSRIIEYIQKKENREEIVRMVKKILLDELPKLSEMLNRAIEEYLSRKNALGNIGMGIKKIVSFNTEAIQDMLQKFIDDPDTTDQFMGVMDILVLEVQEKLASPETQEEVVKGVKDWVDFSGDYAREHILPASIERLKRYLDDRQNWGKIGKYSFRVLEWIKGKLVDFIQSPEGSEYVKKNIAKAIHQINVTQMVEEQVMKLDTDELEKMILDNTGGNLVMIQFLGGILGMIAGFIQVHILFSIPVFALTMLAWISYQRNRLKYATANEKKESV